MEWNVTDVKQTTDVLQLEKCVNDHDGIELKVAADWVGENDFAIYDGEQLVGYLQAFAYLPTEWELNVFVDPDYRKQGIFTALVEAARARATEAGVEAFTFVIDDASSSGQAVLEGLGAEYRMTEYNMILKKAQLFLKADPDFELREATAADRPFSVETLGKSSGTRMKKQSRSIKQSNLMTASRSSVSQAANRSASSVPTLLPIRKRVSMRSRFVQKRKAMVTGRRC